MGYDWRDKTPLSGAERYLWKRLRKYPMDDDCFHPKPRTPMHRYYEEGWELIHHLQNQFWGCCSSHGNEWPFQINGVRSELRVWSVRCRWKDCEKWADSIVRAKPGTHGDSLEYLEDAPHFYCFEHSWEFQYGEKYVPPSLEESRRQRAWWKAMEQMCREKPPETVELDCGLKVGSFTMLDGPYLKRMAEIAG